MRRAWLVARAKAPRHKTITAASGKEAAVFFRAAPGMRLATTRQPLHRLDTGPIRAFRTARTYIIRHQYPASRTHDECCNASRRCCATHCRALTHPPLLPQQQPEPPQ
ncbi:hypothetical protein CBM2585_A60176 [Cupriavidus taiwanensis]|nr:hypothetical protein CBM2585_A60176 [Cupriavidus taiwanensis]